MKIWMILAGFLLMASSCSMEKLYMMKQNRKVYPFEQVSFHDMAKRYMSKGNSSTISIEGIYSVTVVVERKGKGFLSSSETNKVVTRKENYSTVAIVKDPDGPNREYIEIPLDKENLPSYSIRGEFTGMSEANIMVYKHLEPKGKSLTYTFTYDAARDMLEGVRKENTSQAEFTYTLTYLKLYPKKEAVITNK